MSERKADGNGSSPETSAGVLTPVPAARVVSPFVPDAAAPGELERLRLLRAMSLELGATLDPEPLAQATLRWATRATGAGGASLWMRDGDALVCRLAVGRDASRLGGARVPAARILEERDPAVVAAPLVVGDLVTGAIRLTAGDDGAPFGGGERTTLGEIAAGAALALDAARRFGEADRTRDLALVLEMSREITSTLDLDRVFRTVVNLAIRVLAFDRGAVALYERGRCEIRALAGAEQVNPDEPGVRDLAERGAWAAGVGESFYLADRTEPGSDSERILLQVFGADLERDRVGSGLYVPLKDEEGVVGILIFEAERPDFADERQRELIAILANQVTVAVRNAQLYSAVPLADALTSLAGRRDALLAVPARRRALWALAALGAVAALTLVRWPIRISGESPVFRPLGRAEVRALVPGIVDQVLVREGQAITAGAPVVQLRDAPLRAERDAARDAAGAAEREAAIAAARGDAALEQLQRARAATFRREAALLDEQRAATTVRAPASGVVFTARPEERLGAWLAAGDSVVTIGRTDTLDLEFAVRERDIARIAGGDGVRVRVDALPERTFPGRVSWIASVGDSADGEARFHVRARVPNPDGLLRPAMRAYVRVLGAPTSVAGRMLREPLRRLRLLWWRIWS